MNYGRESKDRSQRFIHLGHIKMVHSSSTVEKPAPSNKLFYYRPLRLNEDGYQCICGVPKCKGAKFRNLPSVMVGSGNLT